MAGNAALVATVLGGLRVGAAAKKIEAEKAQEKATADAIRNRATEERIAANEKAIARDRQIKGLIGHQIAVEAASGFELDSPTFEAITIDDFNKFAEERSNDALTLDIRENQLQQDLIQNRLKTNAQIFGDVTSTAASFIPQSGLFTDLSTASGKSKNALATPTDQEEYQDATRTAFEKRSTGDGLFDLTEF